MPPAERAAQAERFRANPTPAPGRPSLRRRAHHGEIARAWTSSLSLWSCQIAKYRFTSQTSPRFRDTSIAPHAIPSRPARTPGRPTPSPRASCRARRPRTGQDLVSPDLHPGEPFGAAPPEPVRQGDRIEIQPCGLVVAIALEHLIGQVGVRAERGARRVVLERDLEAAADQSERFLGSPGGTCDQALGVHRLRDRLGEPERLCDPRAPARWCRRPHRDAPRRSGAVRAGPRAPRGPRPARRASGSRTPRSSGRGRRRAST